jgi:hypothetical protein
MMEWYVPIGVTRSPFCPFSAVSGAGGVSPLLRHRYPIRKI